jgi:hypothetical protein
LNAGSSPERYDASVPVSSSGKRAIDWLAEHTPLSRVQLKKKPE